MDSEDRVNTRYIALQSPETDNEAEEDTVSVSTPVDCFRCRKESWERCCCEFNNYWKILIGGTVITVYLLLGGLLFHVAERPVELMKIQQAQAERNAAVDAFEQSLANFTEMIINRTNVTEETATNFTNVLVRVASALAVANKTLPIETDPIWNFPSAVFFASTVITTIGYGTIAPSTTGGQVLFIFYALFGIPLALTFLSAIGTILSDWLDAALNPIMKHYSIGKLGSRVIGTLTTFMITVIFFILIPAVVFYSVEKVNDWTYLNSVYYCFATLTTVGFGDFVPGIEGSIITDNNIVIAIYKFAADMWLWIGLAIVAALLSQIQCLIEAVGNAIDKCRTARTKKAKKHKYLDDEQELTTPASAGASSHLEISTAC